MATGVTIRTIDGAIFELGIVDGHLVDASADRIDRQLDTAHLWALPGLADCHGHLSGPTDDDTVEPDYLEVARANCWAQLSGGVFLVADKGIRDDVVLAVLDEPPARRPDLHMAGRVLTAPGGYFTGNGIEVDETDLPAMVESMTGGAASWVKLIGDWPRKGVGAVPNYTEEGFAAAARVAHEAGCRAAIHTCAPDTASMAVRAGIDSIEHGLFLTGEDLVALGARKGAWVPTINAMEAIRDRLGAGSSGGRLFAEGLDNVRQLLPGAPEVGVAVLAGTDLEAPHGGVAVEALRFLEYGLTPEQVIAAMTDDAYDYLGTERGFAPGMAADAVFFDRDPREDLSVLGRPSLILRHGEVIGGSAS